MSSHTPVAIITGGGTGVGAATCRHLARLGWSVVVNYSRSQTDADSVVSDILAGGGRAIAIQADVADDAACREMVARTAEEFGRVDLLVNCAGTTDFIPFSDLDQPPMRSGSGSIRSTWSGPFTALGPFASRCSLLAAARSSMSAVSLPSLARGVPYPTAVRKPHSTTSRFLSLEHSRRRFA